MAMDARRSRYRAPFWLRGLILAVAVWLAVRIVDNVTESLTGMVVGAPAAVVERGG